MPEKGTVVYLPNNPSNATVTVKYFEVMYRHDRYDQTCLQSTVFLNLDMADSGKGKRSRRQALDDAEVAATPAPAHRLVTSNLNRRPLVLCDLPISVAALVQAEVQTGGALIIDSQTSEKGLQIKKRRQNNASFARLVQIELESENTEGAAAVLSGAISKENSSSNSSLKSEYSYRFDDFSLHELVHKLFPSSKCTHIISERGIDRHIRRGLLHALWHYLKPPDRRNSHNTGSSHPVTVGQLHELLTVCPTHVDQMRNRKIMPLCSTLLNVLTPDSSALVEVTATPSTHSLAEELVQVVRSYLSERGFDVTANIGLQQSLPTLSMAPQLSSRDSSPIGDDRLVEGKSIEVRSEVNFDLHPLPLTLPRGLSIPLSHDHFVIALDLAFKRLGGREVFENRKGVRGLDFIAPGICLAVCAFEFHDICETFKGSRFSFKISI